MDYEKQNWVDHIEDIETGEVFQEGTLFTAKRMNHIEEGIYQASSQIKENEQQNKIKNRRISYNFSATPWQFSYDGGEHPSRPEQITKQLEKMKYLGFDGIVVMATLIEDGSGDIDFNIPFENYLWYITETIRLGMTVRAVKIHMNETLFTTVTDIETKYRDKVMQLANSTYSYNVTYLVLYN